MALSLKLGCLKETIACVDSYPSEEIYEKELLSVEKLIKTIKAMLKDQTGEDLDWPEYTYGNESSYTDVNVQLRIPSYEALHQLRTFASNLEAIEKKKKIGFGVKILDLLNQEHKPFTFDTPASCGLNAQYLELEAYRQQGKQVHIPVESIFVKGISEHLLKIYQGEEQTRFPHLICHADDSGYYLPCLFKEPLWIDFSRLGGENKGIVSVGSSLALLEELMELNKYLDINELEMHDLSAFSQEMANEELGLVKMTWALLYTICQQSKKYGLAILLNH